MGSEWTPLDDIGRAEAGFRHGVKRADEAVRHLREARARCLGSLDAFLALLGNGSVDWSEATEDEVEAMVSTLDVISRTRSLVAALGALGADE